MDKGILAGRMLEARRTVLAAVETAVALLALDDSLLDNLRAAQREKDAGVRAMAELEAVVPILGALLARVGSVLEMETAIAEMEQAISSQARQRGILIEDVLATPGLSKTSRAALESRFVE